MCTGLEATLPPSPSADSSPPSPSIHTRTAPPSSWALLGFPTSPRPCPALLPQGYSLGIPDRGTPGLLPPTVEPLPLPGNTGSDLRKDSLPSPGPGHCARPQRPGQRWDLGAVHGERQCAVLEGILDWTMAQGGEGQHISSHLTRVISTAITQGAERRGKSPRAPQGRWR